MKPAHAAGRNATNAVAARPARASGRLMEGVFEDCVWRRRDRVARVLRHRREPRDDLEGLAVLDEAAEVDELVFEPERVHDRPADAPDLRVRRRDDGLAVAPELLVQLLAGTGADEGDADVVDVLAGQADHLLGEVDDL